MRPEVLSQSMNEYENKKNEVFSVAYLVFSGMSLVLESCVVLCNNDSKVAESC